jgi:hypothetical protein
MLFCEFAICDARKYLQTFLLKVVLFLMRLASGQRGSAHNCWLPEKRVFIVLYSVEGRALTTAGFLLQADPGTKLTLKSLTILISNISQQESLRGIFMHLCVIASKYKYIRHEFIVSNL